MLHVDVVQIWITVIKWLKNHLNVFKRSNDPWNFPNFDMTVVLVHVKRRKKFEGRKRKLSPVRHQTCIVPSSNHEPSSELLRFVRGVFPNFRQTGQFFYHIILVAWHYIKQGFMFFWSFFIFLKLKCHGTPWMCPCRETNMFENSFYFTAHGINSHTSTQIWFFKPLWLAVACTCSSNLNYDH